MTPGHSRTLSYVLCAGLTVMMSIWLSGAALPVQAQTATITVVDDDRQSKAQANAEPPAPGPQLGPDEGQQAATLVRYPYLQQLSTNSAMIVWTTSGSGASEVHYSTDLSYSNVVTASSRSRTTNAPAPYDAYYEHTAVLAGLSAGTTYHYTIYTAETPLATDSFRTNPPASACTFNFAVFGDTGQDWQPTRDVRDQALARGFDFAVNLGDLAYNNGTYEEIERNFFNVFRNVLSNRMMWTTLGNHEYYTNFAAPYLDVFQLPEHALRPADQERYYSFDYGNAHFVVLDGTPEANAPISYISDAVLDDMADWLDADLTANQSFWQIVMIHQPWYVSNNRSHPYQIHTKLIPLFEKHSVDLVLAGHDHIYERTHPIKNDALSTVADGGVVYITNGEAGGRGNASYPFYNPPPNWSAFRARHDTSNPAVYNGSYTHIYVANGVMSAITIDDQGNVIDPPGGATPVTIIDRSQEPGASCAATVSGTVYEDKDGNGTFSDGDTPLAGVQIDLSDGQNTTTTASGVYSFTNSVAGTYVITETDPVGYLSSGDAHGPNDNLITVTLQAGDSISGLDFFDFRPSSLSGTVYEDSDGNDAISGGDTPLASAQVDLSDGRTTYTNAAGFYEFTDLKPGNYIITETDPAGYVSITPNSISVSLAYSTTASGLDFLDRKLNEAGDFTTFLPIVLKPAAK